MFFIHDSNIGTSAQERQSSGRYFHLQSPRISNDVPMFGNRFKIIGTLIPGRQAVGGKSAHMNGMKEKGMAIEKLCGNHKKE